MLISHTILDDLSAELETATRNAQQLPNAKWLGLAMAKAMIDSKRRELFRHELQADMARSLAAFPKP